MLAEWTRGRRGVFADSCTRVKMADERRMLLVADEMSVGIIMPFDFSQHARF